MAEEDARLLELLNSGNSRLGSLMDALLTLREMGGGDIQAVLQGTPEGIGTFFGLEHGTPIFCMNGFDYALGMEGLGLEYFDGDGWYLRMTKEDAENFFYSVCGKK